MSDRWIRGLGAVAVALAIAVFIGTIISNLPAICRYPFLARMHDVRELRRGSESYMEIEEVGLFYSIEVSQIWDDSLPPDTNYYIRFEDCPEDILFLYDEGSDGKVDKIQIGYGNLSKKPRTALEGFLKLNDHSAGIVLERPTGEDFSYLQAVFSKADELVSYLNGSK